MEMAEVKRGRPLGPTSRDLSFSSSARWQARMSSSKLSWSPTTVEAEGVSFALESDLDLDFFALDREALVVFVE